MSVAQRFCLTPAPNNVLSGGINLNFNAQTAGELADDVAQGYYLQGTSIQETVGFYNGGGTGPQQGYFFLTYC